MSCHRPVVITRALSEFRADNPKRPRPGDPGVFLHSRSGEHRVEMQVPCGKCESCNAARAMQWSVRCWCEMQDHDRVSFITLTYDDEHLPKDGKLVKKDLQDFFKRLRKKHNVRYFACGEYGDTYRRPHYHAIIFGLDFLGDAIPIGDGHFINDHLSNIWGRGRTTVAPASFSTICYTVGYVAKKIGDPDSFQLMSSRPGLGANYISRFEDDLRRTGVIWIEGREYPLPEYFFTQDDFSDIKEFRKSLAHAKGPDARRARGVNVREKTKRRRGSL